MNKIHGKPPITMPSLSPPLPIRSRKLYTSKFFTSVDFRGFDALKSIIISEKVFENSLENSRALIGKIFPNTFLELALFSIGGVIS
jgi:hypothetical protein